MMVEGWSEFDIACMHFEEKVAAPYLDGNPFTNVRTDGFEGTVDFCISSSQWGRRTWKLRQSLDTALRAIPDLAPVRVTTDFDHSLRLRFFNIHLPIDDQAPYRLARIAARVEAWLKREWNRSAPPLQEEEK
jgi:hypothetical protein